MSFDQSPDSWLLRTEQSDNADRARERRKELASEYAGEPAMLWGWIGEDEEFSEARLQQRWDCR